MSAGWIAIALLVVAFAAFIAHDLIRLYRGLR